MAKFRLINTKFWDDSYVAKLSTSEKLLFIYFISNPLTTVAGVYVGYAWGEQNPDADEQASSWSNWSDGLIVSSIIPKVIPSSWKAGVLVP